MKAKYPPAAQIQGWQQASPSRYLITRVTRGVYSTILFSLDLPFIALDSFLGTTFYGRKSWTFKYRALTKLGAYLLWTVNPGSVPPGDVLSEGVRKDPGKLDKGNHASLVEVQPQPDKLLGDALHPDIHPEVVPCFWQWQSDMTSPLSSTVPHADQKVMIYIHGGGMVQGHPTTGYPLPWYIISATKLPIFGINFRKCVVPKSAFPAALQDVVSGYFYLLDQGYKPSNISIMSDSGGGCIAITFVLYILRHFKSVSPGSTIMISPFVDLIDTFDTNKDLLNLDILNPEMCGNVQFMYSENRKDLRGTLLSPARGRLPEGYSFKGFPRSLVNFGDVEVFSPGILRFVDLLKKDGVDVEVVVGKDEVHDYPIWTKESEFHDSLLPFLNGGK